MELAETSQSRENNPTNLNNSYDLLVSNIIRFSFYMALLCILQSSSAIIMDSMLHSNGSHYCGAVKSCYLGIQVVPLACQMVAPVLAILILPIEWKHYMVLELVSKSSLIIAVFFNTKEEQTNIVFMESTPKMLLLLQFFCLWLAVFISLYANERKKISLFKQRDLFAAAATLETERRLFQDVLWQF